MNHRFTYLIIIIFMSLFHSGMGQRTEINFPENNPLRISYSPERSLTTDTAFCYNWVTQHEEWELRNITTNQWDEAGRLIETIVKFYDLDSNSYTPVYRETYSYYSFDSIEYKTDQLWNPEMNNGDWDNIQKTYYEYSPDNMLVYTMDWFSSYGDTTWRNGNQEFYSYNEYNLKDTIVSMYWNPNNNEWFYSDRMRYYYDIQMELSEYYRDFANNQTGDYDLNERELYIPDPDKNQLAIIAQTWWDGEWSNYTRELDTINDLGLVVATLYQNWDPTNMIWDTTVMNRTLFEYTPEEQLKVFINQSYYLMWANTNRYSFEYDDDGNRIEFLNQDWDHSAYEWQNVQLCIYQLPQIITSLSDSQLREDQLIIYPNPAHDQFHIVTDHSDDGNIQIMNMAGQIILDQRINSDASNIIDIKALQDGIYIVQFESDNVKSISRLIKH